jgi:Cu(I)/Ag(I) efflux system membrane fusion protein
MLLEGTAHEHWMMLMKQIKSNLDQMEKSTELESSRKLFSELSTAVLEMTERFGLNKEVVYKDYCPMAFGDQGAFWLSESKNITNPYFGASMLTCGEVKQTYLKGQPVLDTQLPKTTIQTTHNH